MTENSDRPVKSASPLHFARFEFKYILPLNKRHAVEKDLRYFLDYDPFVARRPEHKYIVRSLYYDSPTFSAFHDKIDGLMSRYKFRVRTYSQAFTEDVPIFLELKGRHSQGPPNPIKEDCLPRNSFRAPKKVTFWINFNMTIIENH